MPFLQSLELDRSYIIISTATERLYLDEERKAYLFFLKSEAIAFISSHENTKVSKAVFRNQKKLLSVCYGAGAVHLVITRNSKEELIALTPNRVEPGFYNTDLNAAICLLKETKEEKYIQDMVKEPFLVPVRIKSDNDTQEIVYGIARHHDKGSFSFLAFSDLDEYQKWADVVAGWKPLMVPFDVMCQIGKQHGYIINLMGNRLAFPYQLMKKYRP